VTKDLALFKTFPPTPYRPFPQPFIDLSPNPLSTFPPTPFLKARGVLSPSLSGEGFGVRSERDLG